MGLGDDANLLITGGTTGGGTGGAVIKRFGAGIGLGMTQSS